MQRFLCLPVLLALTVAICAGQDQTLQFSGFNTDVSAGSADDTSICKLTNLAKAGSITDTDLASLRTMVSTVAKRISASFTGNNVAVVHLVIWGDLNVANQVWFVVSADGKWLKQNTVDARLFGNDRPLLVYVYSGLSAGLDQVAYKIASTNKLPENVQNVIELAKAVAGGTIGAFIEPTNSCAWGAHVLPLNHVPADVSIQAFAQKHAKAPAGPSLTATLTAIGGAAPFSTVEVQRTAANVISIAVCKAGACTPSIALSPAGAADFPASLCSRTACEVKELDSSGKTLGYLPVGPLDEPGAVQSTATKTQSANTGEPAKTEPSAIGKKLFNNEDLTWWDVSLMMQVNSITDIQYNASDGTVQPAKVTKQNLFAVGDIFPLRNWERHWMIHGQFISLPIAVAIPLNSTPLNRPFFGAGLGTRAFQFMAGVSYDLVSSPTTLSVGSPTSPSKLAANSDTHRVSKLMLGLNVSVTSVVKALTKSKSGTTSTTTISTPSK
jgi:hypothetical protein